MNNLNRRRVAQPNEVTNGLEWNWKCISPSLLLQSKIHSECVTSSCLQSTAAAAAATDLFIWIHQSDRRGRVDLQLYNSELIEKGEQTHSLTHSRVGGGSCVCPFSNTQRSTGLQSTHKRTLCDCCVFACYSWFKRTIAPAEYTGTRSPFSSSEQRACNNTQCNRQAK